MTTTIRYYIWVKPPSERVKLVSFSNRMYCSTKQQVDKYVKENKETISHIEKITNSVEDVTKDWIN